MSRPIHPLADIANLPKKNYWFEIFVLINLAVLTLYCLAACPIISVFNIVMSVILTAFACFTTILVKRNIETIRSINSVIDEAKLIIKRDEQNAERASEN